MERVTTISKARQIMGEDVIGPAELELMSKRLSITLHVSQACNPEIVPYSEDTLKASQGDYILIWTGVRGKNGAPISLLSLREVFGIDSAPGQPCFYNQDWYLHEGFAHQSVLEDRWQLVSKAIVDSSRSQEPRVIMQQATDGRQFPSAVLAAFTFFCFYFHSNGKILWEHEYLWCSDTDTSGDRIYVGRYHDPLGISREGFQIHRHLSIKKKIMDLLLSLSRGKSAKFLIPTGQRTTSEYLMDYYPKSVF